jgi:hypothetical protein
LERSSYEQQIPFGNDRKKSKGKSKRESRTWLSAGVAGKSKGHDWGKGEVLPQAVLAVAFLSVIPAGNLLLSSWTWPVPGGLGIGLPRLG